MCHDDILRDLTVEFPSTNDNSHVTVLVLSAGQCRLALDICMAGYRVERNDMSAFSYLASSWIAGRGTNVRAIPLDPKFLEPY